MDKTIETVSAATQSQPERWCAIPNFPKLEASTLGRIRSFARPDKAAGTPYRILHTSAGKNGYLTLRGIDAQGVSITRHAHVLIASAFLGQKPEGMLVLHANDVKNDNRPENLRYGTASQNYADSVANGCRVLKRANPHSAPQAVPTSKMNGDN